MDPTTLYTHLKIILLQWFQFSVFSFSNNKFNPNGPIRQLSRHVGCIECSDILIKNIRLKIKIKYCDQNCGLMSCMCGAYSSTKKKKKRAGYN